MINENRRAERRNDPHGPFLDRLLGSEVYLKLRTEVVSGVLLDVTYRPDGTPLVLTVDVVGAIGEPRVPWNAVEWYDSMEETS